MTITLEFTHVEGETRPTSRSQRWRPGRPHECDLGSNLIESDDPIHPVALNGCRATVELHAELDEEGDRSFEVVDDDTDIGPSAGSSRRGPYALQLPVIADASSTGGVDGSIGQAITCIFGVTREAPLHPASEPEAS